MGGTPLFSETIISAIPFSNMRNDKTRDKKNEVQRTISDQFEDAMKDYVNSQPTWEDMKRHQRDLAMVTAAAGHRRGSTEHFHKNDEGAARRKSASDSRHGTARHERDKKRAGH